MDELTREQSARPTPTQPPRRARLENLPASTPEQQAARRRALARNWRDEPKREAA